MLYGDGTGKDTCVTVDMGDYYKINADNSINRHENVSAGICQASMVEREWKDRVDDLYETSKKVSTLALAEGISGKYYSPNKEHVFILWRDADFISHVSAFSQSGDAHSLAVTVVDTMIRHLTHLRETQDPFRKYRKN
jgi:hypothetical protein